MIDHASRIVVKLGSALLVDSTTLSLRQAWLDALCADVATCQQNGKQVLLVSSGAVALGRQALGFAANRILKLEEKQAAAAIGQIRLSHAYQEGFAHHGIAAAQILLTLDDTEHRRRHLNARETLETLLTIGAVPIINENDTIATSEIRYGDNDRLAARVAQMVGADMVILLSDIDGLYNANPRIVPDAAHIPMIESISPAVEAMAGGALAGTSSGGMITKIQAARIATAAGCTVIIASGLAPAPLSRLQQGERHSVFAASTTPLSARKKWLASMVQPKGTLVVDNGAVAALKRGNSLLPAGIKACKGQFARGDSVLITDEAGQAIAQGLSAYDSQDVLLIMGKKSAEIAAILGYSGRDVIVHKDDSIII